MQFEAESACWRITNGDLGRVAAAIRRGNAGPCSERNVPQRNTRDSHLWLRTVTRRELDVALGVIGPAAGFRRSGVEQLPPQDH